MGPKELMASCNAARWAWYAKAVGGHELPPAPQGLALADVADERDIIRSGDGSGAMALEVAHSIENYFGWPAFHGVCLDQEGKPLGFHVWNVLPGCAILDASPDSFGEPAGILVVKPGDPAWERYRKEWTRTYNPSRADRFPELAGSAWDGRPDIGAMPIRRMPIPPPMAEMDDPEPDLDLDAPAPWMCP